MYVSSGPCVNTLLLVTRVEFCTVKNVCVEQVAHRWGHDMMRECLEF